MKRHLLFTLLFFFSLCLKAQLQLQNPSFENWDSTTNPTYWATPNSEYGPNPTSLVTADYTKYTDGLASVKLINPHNFDGQRAYLYNSGAYNGNYSGCAFTQMPDSIAFDYQFNQGIGGNDQAEVSVNIYQGGLSWYGFPITYFATATNLTWTTVTLPFNNYVGQPFTPDSILVYFFPGANSAMGADTTVLWLDNVRFIYLNHPYPTINTDPATNVQLTSAQLNGAVNPNNSTDVSIGFDWGTDTTYGNFRAATPSSLTGSTNTPVSSSTLYGLTPNTTYYYRLEVTSYGVPFYGQAQSFYTTATVTDIPNTASEALVIFPNPAKHQFTVQTESGVSSTLSLCNLLGDKVSEMTLSQPLTTIDVSSYANGIYMVGLKEGDAVKTYRLAIMND